MAAPLSTAAILGGMADALPTHPAGDDSSDLASSYEAIALLIHAYMAALGFKLQGFDEDKRLAECKSLAPRLPPQWNAGFGSLSFVYTHKQSAMTFVIRVDRMGGKVEIRGLAIGDENIHRFERTVRDVVQSSSLPVRITMNGEHEDRSDLAEKLRGVFVSEQAITDILNDLRVNIIQRLIPKLQSEGYVETAEAEATARSERRDQEARDPNRPFRNPDPNPNVPHPAFNPLPDMARPRPHPVGDFPPPGFEDEYEMNRPPRGLAQPHLPPYNIGHDDLNPPGLGPHDPLRGSFVGGGLPRPGGGAGMHPTFDDPLFGGSGAGSGGYDPQAPPGARWDPLGPGGGPRFPGPGGGGGNNPFGGFGGGHII
ncbi:PI31 proteasome regulator N-terminal-domain-containing protein [Dactylonectria estremocensis]|uniref:PI31 proteasome regulator N-terminal-domain-containing protein n=1 Tax=Dactylonectria estremocensis TaxID=1079267 RepID=A0A9P9J6V0_9HYPO|nr:PI31 proteasome regulator N-terminal-domain-containing protein [Dactylonectria estremocensis]